MVRLGAGGTSGVRGGGRFMTFSSELSSRERRRAEVSSLRTNARPCALRQVPDHGRRGVNYAIAEQRCALTGSFVVSDRDARQAAFLQQLMSARECPVRQEPAVAPGVPTIEPVAS